jgi:glycosyltransferase involved in cell wall biosynthesis
MISIVIISKDEDGLDDTLTGVTQQAREFDRDSEVIVVDASAGRLADIAQRHPDVRWINFTPPSGVRISIPHQRNLGVRSACGEVIVFIDAACHPHAAWLESIVAPILGGYEDVVAGAVPEAGQPRTRVNPAANGDAGATYVLECPTLNLAFTRTVFDALGGFDERFEYGSDVDFSWRLNDAGYRIRRAEEAVVEHEWGTVNRRLRRSYLYGRARARLYVKHRRRRRDVLSKDPVVLAYPLFLLGLPLMARFRLYPLLLAIPAWRNRHLGVRTVLVDHLAFGVGAISEVLDANLSRNR